MPRIRDILPGILAMRSSAIDQALSHALTHADADEVGDLASAILKRDNANGVESLITQFHRLPAATRNRVVSHADDYAPSIRKAAARKGSSAPANALTIIELGNATRLAYLAAALCRSLEPKVRQQAGRCLVALAKRAVSSAQAHEQPHMNAQSTGFLSETLDKAVKVFSRDDQAAILEAMLWLMPRKIGDAQQALSEPGHNASPAMASLIAQTDCEAASRMLLLLVGFEPLGTACIQALAHANASRQLARPLAMGHLLALPAGRGQLNRLTDDEALWPGPEQQKRMPEQARRWLPSYLSAISPSPSAQVPRLTPLIKQPDLATRLATLRRLIAIARGPNHDNGSTIEAANDAIAQFTRDPEPAIARTAFWHLVHVDYAGLPHILSELINSKHQAIRRVAAQRLAPLGFERLWEAWPKLTSERRLTAGRALIKIDQDFHRHLGTRLASTHRETRLRALVMIAALNQGFFFEDALLELCTSDDKHIVASAVRALSGCTSKAAHQVLTMAIEHEDTRIRANGLEAMSQSQTAANLDKLIDLADEDAQRPRANAIKALLELKAKDALPSLTRMLSDHRSAHRISALWLIDELGILQVAKLVAEMSLTDEDRDVKTRAASVIQHLIQDLEQHEPAKPATTGVL